MNRTFLLITTLASAWVLSARVLPAIDEGRSLYIEGYAGDVSYAPGDELQLHLSSPSPTCYIAITRIGKSGRSSLKRKNSKVSSSIPCP